MDDQDTYLILRYSLVQEQQSMFDVRPLPSTKGEAILVSIENDREFVLNGVTYSFVGFKRIQPTRVYRIPADRLHLGKFAKRKTQQTGQKIPGDILEFKHDNWIPVPMIVDTKTQHIIVKKDWRVGTVEQIIGAIQAGLNGPVFSIYNHRVFVKGKTEKTTFWKIVDTKKSFYKLEMKLVSPNILDTNVRAREALESLQHLFDQDELSLSLKNESGKLKIPKDPIDSYLEYITEGEGTWKIVTEGDHGGKKVHSSVDNIQTISLPDINKDIPSDDQLDLIESSEHSDEQKPDEIRLVSEAYEAIKENPKN